MKHITKRALSLLLTLAMLCGLLCTTTFATSSGQRLEAVTSLETGEQYIITATSGGTTYALSAEDSTAPGATANFRKPVAINISGGYTNDDISKLTWDYDGTFSNEATGKVLRGSTSYLFGNGTASAASLNGNTLTINSKTVVYGKYSSTMVFSCAGSQVTTTTSTITVYKLVSDTASTTYTVTFSATNATVSGEGISNNSATVAADGTLSFTVTATDGYQVDSVTATNGTVSGSNGSYTLSSVTADTIVTVATSAVATTSYAVTFTGDNATVSGEGISNNSATVAADGTLSFTVTAADGYQVDSVTATNGTVSGSNGSYTLSGVTANTTVTVVTSLVQSGGDSEDNEPWDGTSATPSQDTDDYYIISNAKELAGFAELVNSGSTTINAKLTADIDLNNVNRTTAIGTSSNTYKGIFDGQGHTISNLSFSGSVASYGLFGYINGATIKNLIVAGTIINTATSTTNTFNYGTAGIVGVANGSFTIQNCGNEVDISANCSVGGIVGAMNVTSGTQTISSCYNTGDLTASGTYGIVGGITGYLYNVGTLNITNCYNVGTIMCGGTGSYTFAAGILGCSYDSGITVQNCYHAGTVSGSNYAQIACAKGNSYLPTATNCYTTGTGSSGSYVVNGTQKAAAEITVTLLGSAYQENPNGTPALAWETVTAGPTVYNVTFFASNATVSGADITNNSATVEEGGTLSFIVTANEGYQVNSVTATNGTVSGGNGSYTLTNVTADTTVTVATTAQTGDEGSGSGTKEDPYRITNEAGLKQLAASVNSGTSYAGIYFKLTNDITVSNGWTPIGTAASPFKGNFDGGNHVVALYYTTTANYSGLFGYISDATVERIFVTGTVSGGNYVAGVAGYALNSTIRYCGNAATVTGSGYVGGIVSYANGTAITACYNKGNVSNNASTDVYTGGIVGYLTNGSSVMYCYNTGAISATLNSDNYCYTGGIAGMGISTPIARCYSTGTITSTSTYTGGIVGSANAYYEQSGRNYYLEGSAQRGVGYNTGGSNDDSAEYVNSVSAADLKDANSTAVRSLGTQYKAPQTGVNDGYPTLKWETDSTYDYDYITAISTKYDLEEFAFNVKSGYSYEGTTVTLLADIDLGGYYTDDSNYGNLWTTIGSMSGGTIDTAFAGTFDGNDHTISNMVILNSASGYQGLFAILDEGGTVKNLTVSGIIDLTQSSVGSIVGWNLGTVENCVSNVSINAPNTQFVGGIVGDNAGTVKNCVNNGTVSSYQYVGGIVGHCEPAYDSSGAAVTTPSVEDCVNTGDVTGSEYVGGVVGAEFNDDGACASITGSANSGDVTSSGYAGGIVGYMSAADDNYDDIDITDCYNTGDVYGTSDVGGIVGHAGLGELTIENCFNSGAVSGSAAAYVGEIAGYTKANINNTYYVLDTSVEQISVASGSGSGDNYTRPVTYAYLDTAAFEDMIGYEYTLPEDADENETASYYAYDIYSVNILQTSAAAAPAAQSEEENSPTTSASVTATTVTITRLSDAYNYSLTGFKAPEDGQLVYYAITDAMNAGEDEYPKIDGTEGSTDITKDTYGSITQAVFHFDSLPSKDASGNKWISNDITVLAAPKEIHFYVENVTNDIDSRRDSTLNLDLGSFDIATDAAFDAVTKNSYADSYRYTVTKTMTGEQNKVYNGSAKTYVTLTDLLEGLGFTVSGSTVSYNTSGSSCTEIAFTPIDAVLPTHTRSFTFASGTDQISLAANGAILAIESCQSDQYTGETLFAKTDRLNAVRLITGTSYTTPAGSAVSDSVKWISQIQLTVGTALKLGDVNGDGAVTSNDVERITSYINYINGVSTSTAADDLSKLQFALADVSGNGVVDSEDTALINSYLRTISAGSGN